MAQEFTGVSCGDNYTNAATILDVYLSAGGVFEIQNNTAFYQLQYGHPDGHQGSDFWSRETFIGTGGGSIPKGVTGIRFRNSTPGQVSVVSAVIRGEDEPFLSLSFPAPVTPAGVGAVIQLQQTTLAVNGILDFQGIDQLGFSSLQLWAMVRSSAVALNDNLTVRFNADAGANYDGAFLAAVGAAAVGNGVVGTTSMIAADIPAVNAFAGRWAVVVIDIPFYTNPNLDKQIISRSSNNWNDTAANQEVDVFSGAWRNLSAVNQIDLSGVTAPLIAGSQAVLYGVV